MRQSTTELVALPQGRKLRLRRWSGRGAPLVLLHGLLDSAEGWDQLANATTRPVLAFDLPGFGHSSAPTRPRISAYAKDIQTALNKLGVERYLLLGHSLGGAIATALAELDQDKVKSLTLMAPCGFGRIRIAEALSLPAVRSAAELATPFVLANPLIVIAGYSTFVTNRKRPSPELVQRIVSRAYHSVPGVKAATLAVARSGQSRYAFYKRQVNYQGPVRALWGDHDHLVPLSHSKNLVKALPQTEVVVWKHMGHHPQWERPEELERFIEDC